ncbi:MAG: sensor histidine kinase [Gaiellales bacterium]
MDWLVDRVFPFRRLTIWLGLLLLVVIVLALALTAVLVLPTLDESLVSNRVDTVARSADQSAATFQSNFENALAGSAGSPDTDALTAAYGQLTNTDAAVYQVMGPTELVPVTAPTPPGGSAVAEAAATRPGIAKGVVSVGGTRMAQAAYPMEIAGTRYVVLLSSTLDDVDASVALTIRQSLIGALIAVPLAVVIGALAAALLTRRLRRLERSARQIAAGRLDEPIRDRGKDEIGDLAVALDRMRDEIAATDAARRAFVANASHELRTPVFALAGFLELLVDEDDEDTRRQFLATMQDQVGRLTKLATDLLDLSRLDAGKVPMEHEPIELAAIAERIAGDLAPLAAKSGAVLTVDAQPAMAVGDEARIGQITRVLIDNALRHNPAGVEIHVTTAHADGTAAIVVEDTGPRIPAEDEAAIFTRFARGTQAGEGSGLGLAIASELALRMGGRLVLDQRGARKAFRLELRADTDG